MEFEPSNIVPFAMNHSADFLTGEVYEFAAEFLAHLAFPISAFPNEDRYEIKNYLIASTLKRYAAYNEEWGDTYLSIKPKYLTYTNEKTEGMIKRFFRALDDRMRSARIGLFYLKAADDINSVAELYKRYNIKSQKINLESFLEIAQKSGEPIEPHNFKARGWKPSRSVLHLAVSLQMALVDWQRVNEKPMHIADFLFNKTLLERVVNRAHGLARSFNSSKLQIQPSEQMTFLIKEDARKYYQKY